MNAIAWIVALAAAGVAGCRDAPRDPIGELRAPPELGLVVAARMLPAADHEARLAVTIRTTDGRPVLGANVEAALDGTGRRAMLEEVDGGLYDRIVDIETGTPRRVDLYIRHGADHYAGSHRLVPSAR